MTINEPLTLITDYILSLASLVFGVLLWRRNNRLWALGFFFTALGSFLGGTYHGFGGMAVWIATVYAIGIASLLFLWPFQRVVAIFLFIVYAAWMTVHYADFKWVIADYGITMLLLTFLLRSKWMTAFLLVSIAGAVVQQMPIPFHNDIYHAIQLFGLWLLYRAGLTMTATGRSTNQPT
jgi:hypothetical protein